MCSSSRAKSARPSGVLLSALGMSCQTSNPSLSAWYYQLSGPARVALQVEPVTLPPRRPTGDLDPHAYQTAVEIGDDVERFDVRARHLLQPDRLPDARHRRVPDASWATHLFAARLIAGVGRIPHAHHQLLLAVRRRGLQGIGDVGGELVVTATM